MKVVDCKLKSIQCLKIESLEGLFGFVSIQWRIPYDFVFTQTSTSHSKYGNKIVCKLETLTRDKTIQ